MITLGKLVILAGPSGVGKRTIWQPLVGNQNYGLNFSISCTTRTKRDQEIDGQDYYFLSVSEFQKKIANNEFLEHAIYANNYYGTLKKNVTDKLDKGSNVFLEIEIQGVKQILINLPKKYTIISIFVAPPSLEELKKRLVNRHTESAEVIAKRLEFAKAEIACKDLFKYIIVNDDITVAQNKLKRIFDENLTK